MEERKWMAKCMNDVIRFRKMYPFFRYDKKEDLKAKIEMLKTESPIKENEHVANLIVTTPDGDNYSFKVYAQKEVKKSNFFDYLFYNWLEFLF